MEDDQSCLSRALRHAFHLVQLTPRSFRHLVNCSLSEDQFEQLLHVGAELPAALALSGQQLGYELQRTGGGDAVKASVLAPAAAQRFSFVSHSPAAALFTCWLDHLLWISETASRMQLIHPVPHRYRSERRPRQMEH